MQIQSLSSILNAKGKNVDNDALIQLKTGIRTFYTIQKQVRLMQKQPSSKL